MPEFTFDDIDTSPKAAASPADKTFSFDDIDTSGGGQAAPFQVSDAYQKPFWSWDRIKNAYQTSPESVDVSPYAGKILKNAALGAGEAVTGMGEIVPGPIGSYAAKGTQALRAEEDPDYWAARDVGLAAPFAVSGFGAGGLAARLAPETGVAARFLGSSVGRNAVRGAVGGVEGGAAQPTGEEDTGKRYLQKAESAGEGALAGAGLGASLGVIPPMVGGAGKMLGLATGRTATKEAEAARAAGAGEAQKAIGAIGEQQEREFGGASADELRKAAEEQRFQADQASAAADQIALEMSSKGGTIDSVQFGTVIRKRAEEIFAEGDRKRTEEAGFGAIMEKYGDKPIVKVKPIVDDLAKEVKRLAPGGTVDNELDKVSSYLKATEAPPVEAVGANQWKVQLPDRSTLRLTGTKTGDRFDLGQAEFVDPTGYHVRPVEINDPSVRTALGALADKYPDIATVNGVPIEQAGDLTAGRISLPVAQSVRQELRKIITTKQVATSSGVYRPVDANTLRLVNRIYIDLGKAAGEAAPEYRQATEIYRRLSRDVDFVERKGALADALKTEGISGNYTKLQGDIITALANKTKKGDTSFAKLMQADPSLRDSARQYYVGELFGREPARGPVEPERFAKFLVTNSHALDQLGLYDEFATSQKALATAKELAKGTEGAAETAEKTAGDAAKLEKDREKYEKAFGKLTQTDLPPEKVPTEAKSLIDSLLDDGHITQERWEELHKQVNHVLATYKETADISRHVTNIMRYAVAAALGAAGIEISRRIYY